MRILGYYLTREVLVASLLYLWTVASVFAVVIGRRRGWSPSFEWILGGATIVFMVGVMAISFPPWYYWVVVNAIFLPFVLVPGGLWAKRMRLAREGALGPEFWKQDWYRQLPLRVLFSADPQVICDFVDESAMDQSGTRQPAIRSGNKGRPDWKVSAVFSAALASLLVLVGLSGVTKYVISATIAVFALLLAGLVIRRWHAKPAAGSLERFIVVYSIVISIFVLTAAIIGFTI